MKKLLFVESLLSAVVCGVLAQTADHQPLSASAVTPTLAGKTLYARLDTTSIAQGSLPIDEFILKSMTVTNQTKHDKERLVGALENAALADARDVTFSAPTASVRAGKLRGLWPKRRPTKSRFCDNGVVQHSSNHQNHP